MIDAIREVVAALRAHGVAMVLVEQRVEAVLRMADRVAFMVQGRIAETVARAELSPGSVQFRTHVGI